MPYTTATSSHHGLRRSVVSLLAVLAVAACGEETTAPPPDPVDLRTIWPLDEGTSWTYRVQEQRALGAWEFTPLGLAGAIRPVPAAAGPPPPAFLPPTHRFPRPEDVPPPPDFATVQAFLEDPPGIRTWVAYTYRTTLTVSGTETLGEGWSGLRLVESHQDVAGVPCGFDIGERLLRGTCVDPLPACPGAAEAGCFPTLIALRRTSGWIGLISEIVSLGPDDPSLTYLTEELSPGSEFAMPLLRGLRDGVELRVRVMGRRDVETEAGRFGDALEVLYRIDYGVESGVVDEERGVEFWRLMTFARIFYAPGVGPVRYESRSGILAGDPPHAGWDEEVYDLLVHRPAARDGVGAVLVVPGGTSARRGR